MSEKKTVYVVQFKSPGDGWCECQIYSTLLLAEQAIEGHAKCFDYRIIKRVVGQKGGDLNEIIAKTCKQYGVSTLADLPNKAADEVLQRLNSKITELAKTPAKDAAG
jgi:hypothetical protein